MSVSKCVDAAYLRDLYGRLDLLATDGNEEATVIVDAIEAAYTATTKAFVDAGYSYDRSDVAEEFVGCIMGFFLNSNPSMRAFIKGETD